MSLRVKEGEYLLLLSVGGQDSPPNYARKQLNRRPQCS